MSLFVVHVGHLLFVAPDGVLVTLDLVLVEGDLLVKMTFKVSELFPLL